MSYDYPDGYVPEPYVPPSDWWEVLGACFAEAAIWAVIDPDRLEAEDWLEEGDAVRCQFGPVEDCYECRYGLKHGD